MNRDKLHTLDTKHDRKCLLLWLRTLADGKLLLVSVHLTRDDARRLIEIKERLI